MKNRRFLLFGLLALAALMVAGAGASPGTTERVSVDSVGNQGNDHSDRPAISADGRFVAFQSYADNLVPGDTNNFCFGVAANCPDVFVHDRQTGATERVSLDSAGNQGNGNSFRPAMSGDGRFVAFSSYADNLVAGDTNGQADVFVHDRQTGATARVSVDSAGNQGNGNSGGPAISGDGRFVAFGSGASNLVAGDTNAWDDIFVHDRQTGTTERVSVDSAGNQGNFVSGAPAMSSDGRFVAFHSGASNLVTPDSNGFDSDIFVHDRQTGATERVSVDSAGNQANRYSYAPAITADARFVAFNSVASNLVTPDSNGSISDVFVHDRQTGATTRVSVDSAGNQGNSGSGEFGGLAISADGRFVAFNSYADNLVPGDTNNFCFGVAANCPDVFVHDRQTATTKRVNVDSAGIEGNFGGGAPDISGDGRFVAFSSGASNLVAGDTNGRGDVFVHDLGDADGDGEWDPFDNCPAWPNADQSLPPWPVTLDGSDPDCDGFATADETFMGTEPQTACAATNTANDEALPDAWPFDFNDDQRAAIGDVIRFIPVFNSFSPNAPYDPRYDLNASGGITLADVMMYIPVFNMSCTP